MAKAVDLMPKFPMTSITPSHVIASLMQVNNPCDPKVVDDVPNIEKMTPHIPDNEDIRRAMKCRRCKSAVMDNVPPFLWYFLQDDIFKDVCDIVRLILAGLYYPEVFRYTRLFPLYKKGDKSQAKAWRPIAITAALYRIVFKLMYQQLYEHLEPQLHQNQFGARKKRSCAQATLTMNVMLESYRTRNPNQNVFLSLLDITNAFSSVPIHLLMKVMEKRGVPVEWLSMIFEASYLGENCSYNPITQEYDYANAYSGVKQGCPLSPLMFSAFIDPLFSIPGLVDHLVCYIDDIAVVHTSRESIKQAIASIRTYLARLGLLLNPSKSNVMGYVHTIPDEFGNLVDPPVRQKVDCFGNTYFD